GQQGRMTEPDHEGQRIRLRHDEWTIGETIGAGGGGTVYRASSATVPEAAAKLIAKAPGLPRELLFEQLPEGVRNVIPVLDSGGTSTHWVVITPYAHPYFEKSLEDGFSRLLLTE